MTWSDTGTAWGARAADWATLIDPWSLPIYRDVLDRLDPQAGENALDLACGSGMASLELSRRGVHAAGLDASTQLVDIAVDARPTAISTSATSRSCRGPTASSTS